VEEKGGKWGLIHLLEKAFVIPGGCSSNQPSSQTLYHIKPYLSNTKHIKLWANMSQYLISKCYNFAQKSLKTITKSYKTYGKNLKMFENFQGFFDLFRNVLYRYMFRDFLYRFVMSIYIV